MKVKDHLFTKRSLSQFKGGGLGAYVGRVCLTKPVVFTLGHNLLKVGGGEQLVLQLISVIVLKPLRKPSQPKGMMLQRWVWVMHPFSQSVFTKAYKVLTLQYMLRSACESQFPSYKWFKILIGELKKRSLRGQKIYAIMWVGRILWVVFLCFSFSILYTTHVTIFIPVSLNFQEEKIKIKKN